MLLSLHLILLTFQSQRMLLSLHLLLLFSLYYTSSSPVFQTQSKATNYFSLTVSAFTYSTFFSPFLTFLLCRIDPANRWGSCSPWKPNQPFFFFFFFHCEIFCKEETGKPASGLENCVVWPRFERCAAKIQFSVL